MSFGRDSLLAKVDVRSTYRNVPVHPEDRWMLGMLWEGGLYVDKTLPFGLRSAPKIFTALADAVEWVARQEGVRYQVRHPIPGRLPDNRPAGLAGMCQGTQQAARDSGEAGSPSGAREGGRANGVPGIRGGFKGHGD